MADLNRRNVFARKGELSGRMIKLDYMDAYALWKQGGELFEKIMPDHSWTRAEKARIPWTPVPPR